MRMWHWRDVLCWFKLKFSKDGYSVKEFCGKCEKCNRLFGAMGVIPCPARFKEGLNLKQGGLGSPSGSDLPGDESSRRNTWYVEVDIDGQQQHCNG